MAAEAGCATTAIATQSRSFPVPILLGIAVAAVAFSWLNHINPEFPITDDGVRDQLMARDGVELGRCYLIGPLTSVPGFHQGAVWIDLLMGIRLFGGTPATARTVVLGLLAGGVGTVCVIVWRWLRPAMALPAAGLLLAALSLDTYPSLLINPSAATCPDIFVAAGLLCYGLSRRRRFLALAAFALGLAINVHVGALSLIPALLVIVVLASRRPLHELGIAAGLLLAPAVLTSRAAMIANVRGLASHGRLFPAVAIALLLLLLSARRRSWFHRQTWEARAWLVGGILITPFAAGVLWLLVWQRHGFGFSYLHPVLAPAAVLAAALLSAPFELVARYWKAARWIPTAAACGFGLAWLTGLTASAPRGTAPNFWTLADATAIGERARQLGWSYEQLIFHVQSRACRALVVGMAVAAPAPATPAVDKGRTQVQVLRATPDHVGLRERPDVIALDNGDVAIVRAVDSWLQPDALVACRVPLTSATPNCMPALSRAADPGRRFLFALRSFPEIHSVDTPPPYVARYEVPLAPARGERRDILVADDTPSGCGWRITRADGVQVDGGLPADRVRLHSDTGAAGRLVFERAFGTPECAADIDRRYPPCVLEVSPDDPLQALAEGR